MIDIRAARELLDFGAAIGDERRAEEQLAGAVAIHNTLERHDVAYLADEVGMGKTYVALGAMALFRHFQPEFRVLVIAPRENIQRKWIKELGNFCGNNVRFPDFRVKSVRYGPARPMVACENLRDFIHEVSVDSRRDFFLRLSSFSLGISSAEEEWRREGWKKERDKLRAELPWIADDVFALRNKEAFKDNIARAVCCALPRFDLVIVDEAHNLKHGFRAGVAARNRVLALAFGHPSEQSDHKLFPGYGRRAKRVLLLSATPLEESYVQLWNQLDVLGVGGKFADLKRRDVTDDEKKRVASQFLIRRVTTAHVNGKELTKNQYRREWRKGGVKEHDAPIAVTDARQRLIVALVQKKVGELLGSGKFNMSFQIGMLASFESFLQTAKLRRDDDEDIFDDPEQKRDLTEAQKEGLDVRDINRLAKDYRNTFGEEMPHPKMDEVVASLAKSWLTGNKTLVFVRRVASVKELKQKLDECYDKWLIPHLRANLPPDVHLRFDGIVERYRADKREAQESRQARLVLESNEADDAEDDRGGTDTFFAWFFRGKGPKGVVSGANIQKRFRQSGTAYSTFFERNHVAEILGARTGSVVRDLAACLELEEGELADRIRERAAKYLSRAKVHPGRDRFTAAQAAALELLSLMSTERGLLARSVFHELYQSEVKKPHALQAPDVSEWLDQATFFSELQQPQWANLRAALWPSPAGDDPVRGFRESELRGQLLSAAARLGHGLIDIYLLTIERLNSLDLRTLESDAGDAQARDSQRITQYLDRLEAQRITERTERAWGAFDELSAIASNFALIMDVNSPQVKSAPLNETPRLFGTLLGEQQPVGGMSGQVNRTLVQQFRMPGYPFVLVSTDLLQEGEDLHTFCSSIHHYGISWTPSSMEQRTGRIDRVRSQTDRRLSSLNRDPHGADLLQVHFPHLQDSVEILQVERVLERMNVFLRLMHEGLSTNSVEIKHIDIDKSLARGRRPVALISEKLQTAFPILPGATDGDIKKLAVTPSTSREALIRFDALPNIVSADLVIEWSAITVKGQLFGTMMLGNGRIQPFTLFLDSVAGRLVVRCVSPVGVVNLREMQEAIEDSVRKGRVRLGAILDRDDGSYNLTVQEDVVLGDAAHDSARVIAMLRRVGDEADRLELTHLPGQDRALQIFADDLKQEGIARD